MVKQQLENDLKTVIKQLGFTVGDIVLSISKITKFGDYSTNIPLQLAKQSSEKGKQSPIQIANEISQKMQQIDYLKKIEIVEPGFLNFFMDPQSFVTALTKIDQQTGWSNTGNGAKVVLEHTSVNPNKAMHIGHLRNALIGDTLARILRMQGYQVETQNYIDDTGVQVADTYVGLKHLAELGFREKTATEAQDDYFWDLYAAVNRKYAEDPDFLKYREQVQRSLEDQSSPEAKEAKELASKMVSAIQQTIGTFGISHNLLVWESDILKLGFWDSAFELLKETPGFEQETEGKNKGTWLVRFKDSDKIFVRSNGTTTYTAKDFAYNLWKFGLLGKDFYYKKWEKEKNPDGTDIFSTDSSLADTQHKFGQAGFVYTVIDERQSYPQQVIKEVFIRLNYQQQAVNLRHISYGVVNLSPKTAEAMGVLIEGSKKSYTMSGRKGIGVKVKDLLNLLIVKLNQEKHQKTASTARSGSQATAQEIAIAAIKYYMLKYNSATEIIFDLDQAVSIYGATGPYLQYTYARICGILDKVKDVQVEMQDYSPNEDELALIRKILDWPNILNQAIDTLEPSHLATYAFELAQTFNTFYERNQVAKAEESATKVFRTNLLRKIQIVLKNVLDSMGIQAPEKM